MQSFFRTGLLYLRRNNIVFLNLPHNNQHKCQTHQDTWYDTCDKHIPDRNACDGSINHKRNTGRNDDCNGTCRRHQCRGKGGRKSSALDHSRNQHSTQCRNGCRAGTGDGPKEAGNNNTHHGNTALAVTHAGIHKFDQSCGNAGFRHDITGQYKKRNCQQQKFTDTGIHVCSNDRQRCAGIQDCTHRGKPQAQRNRHIQDQKNKKGKK